MSRKRNNRRAKTPTTPTQAIPALAGQAPAAAVPARPAPPAPTSTAAQPAQAGVALPGDLLADGAGNDEAAVTFFSAPPVTHSVEPLPPEPVAERAPVRRIGDAARRRDLARYVTGAVALCFLICVAAAVRAGTVRADTYATLPAPAMQVAARPAAPAPQAVNEPEAVQTPPEVAPQAVEPPPAAESAGEPSPEHAANGVEGASAQPADARAAKRTAQRAIDRGDAVGAIDAAQQSLELDDSDAETWLILGAAQLQRGAQRDARESFASCVRKATHGDKGECRALLR
jgi:hypothetical protein